MEIKAKILEEELKNSFKEGRIAGIKEYAWMKNGIFYVGTTGKTLKKALEEVENKSEE